MVTKAGAEVEVHRRTDAIVARARLEEVIIARGAVRTVVGVALLHDAAAVLTALTVVLTSVKMRMMPRW